MIRELSKNIKDTLEKESRPYLLEFYSPSCGVCQQIKPFLDAVAAEYGDVYGFYNINVEVDLDYAQEHNIRATPALLFVKEGITVSQHVGYITKEDIIKKLTESFGSKKG
jgi:thioredoxin 2